MFEQIKCVVCEEYAEVQVGSELANECICAICKDEEEEKDMSKVMCSCCQEVEVRVIGEFNDEVMCYECAVGMQEVSKRWEEDQDVFASYEYTEEDFESQWEDVVEEELEASAKTLDSFEEFMIELAKELDAREQNTNGGWK